MNTLFILIGIATTYAGPYVGRPLYCDRDGTLLYTLPCAAGEGQGGGCVPSKIPPSPAQRGRDGVGAWSENIRVDPRGSAAVPSAWVALDVRQFQTDAARCGDHVVLLFPEGQVLLAQALDAGPFRDYYVADCPALSIVADVPAHLWPVAGLSAPVHLLNLSALDRAMEIADVHFLP